jgi:hypothetical protein
MLCCCAVDEMAAYFGVFPSDMAGWEERGYDYTHNQVRRDEMIGCMLCAACYVMDVC